MANKPTLSIRFTLNRGTGIVATTRELKRTRSLTFAHTVVEEVGLAAADERYNDLKSRVRDQIREAVSAEIGHMAFLYQKFIIGRERRRFQGTLTSIVTHGYDAEGKPRRNDVALDYLIKPWADWAPLYKRWKQRKYPPPRWFQNTGGLKSMINEQALEEWFGPIRISVERDRTKSFVADAKGSFSVGKIYVRVFGKITPEMLPSLTTGKLNTLSPDARTSGLLNLVHQINPEAAYRLGGNPATTPDRQSVNPFLSFVLTRAVPSAVFSTVSSLAGAKTATGSAGRTR